MAEADVLGRRDVRLAKIRGVTRDDPQVWFVCSDDSSPPAKGGLVGTSRLNPLVSGVAPPAKVWSR